MEMKKYDYNEENYPRFSDDDLDRNRYRIVEDAYWNARNLKEIIEEVYDTSEVHGLHNRKEEVVFSLVALTCELYLKSLVYANLEQKSIVYNHDLYSLFDLLPNEIKKTITDLSEQTVCAEEMENNRDVFVRFRYSYEMKGYRINASFLFHLMSALSRFCDKHYSQTIVKGKGKWHRVGYCSDGYFYRLEIE